MSTKLSSPHETAQHSEVPEERRPPRHWENFLFAATFLLSLLLLGTAVFHLIRWAGFESVTGSHWLLRTGPVFLALVAICSGLRWLVLLSLSAAGRLRSRYHENQVREWPFVSIFVPCFNESETIESALSSLMELDYPCYEIIVVNDGSTDDTLARARQYEGTFGGCTVRVLDKPNGGKWSAHNLAFRHSRGEIILCVDADSRLDPPALRKMVARMSDHRVQGVAGQMRVRNRESLVTRLQGLEYVMNNGACRLGQGLFGTVLIVPGPIGLFRRSAMEEVWHRYARMPDNGHPGHVAGPFEGDTFAEDFDLSLAILSLGGRIVYEPGAVSHTRAPATQYALINQRYRWIRGSMQVVRKLFTRSRSDPEILTPRLLAWVTGSQLLDLFIFPVIYLCSLGFFMLLLLTSSSPLPLISWFAAFLLMQLCAGAYFITVHNDDLRLLKVLPLYWPYNAFVLLSAWVISAIDQFRGSRMHW